MSRSVLLFDRIIVILLGLLFIAFGAAVITWWAGEFHWVGTPLRVSGLNDLGAKSWWGASMLAGGAIATLLALRWLYAHIDRHRVERLVVKGSSKTGHFQMAPGAVVDAAAQILEDAVGVRNAKGRIYVDSGQLVARLDVSIEPTANLDSVVVVSDEVAQNILLMIGQDKLRSRIDLSVARRAKTLPRVK
jgi:hypothetical protein